MRCYWKWIFVGKEQKHGAYLRDQVRGDGGFAEDGKRGYGGTKAKEERLKKFLRILLQRL